MTKWYQNPRFIGLICEQGQSSRVSRISRDARCLSLRSMKTFRKDFLLFFQFLVIYGLCVSAKSSHVPLVDGRPGLERQLAIEKGRQFLMLILRPQ